MSRIALISDIHGNLPALQAVLKHIEKSKVDRILCLGDLVGFYSMVNETLDLLRERNIFCLKGNHDHALLFEEGIIPRSKTCTRVLQRQINEVRPDHQAWLRTLVARADLDSDLGKLTLVHGGLDNPVDEYLYEVPPTYFSSRGFQGKWFFHGHTHAARLLRIGDVTCLNPGSVGQPRDGDARAGYCTVSKSSIEFYRVEYDPLALENDMKSKGYDDYIIDTLRKGTKIGGGV